MHEQHKMITKATNITENVFHQKQRQILKIHFSLSKIVLNISMILLHMQNVGHRQEYRWGIRVW